MPTIELSNAGEGRDIPLIAVALTPGVPSWYPWSSFFSHAFAFKDGARISVAPVARPEALPGLVEHGMYQLGLLISGPLADDLANHFEREGFGPGAFDRWLEGSEAFLARIEANPDRLMMLDAHALAHSTKQVAQEIGERLEGRWPITAAIPNLHARMEQTPDQNDVRATTYIAAARKLVNEHPACWALAERRRALCLGAALERDFETIVAPEMQLLEALPPHVDPAIVARDLLTALSAQGAVKLPSPPEPRPAAASLQRAQPVEETVGEAGARTGSGKPAVATAVVRQNFFETWWRQWRNETPIRFRLEGFDAPQPLSRAAGFATARRLRGSNASIQFYGLKTPTRLYVPVVNPSPTAWRIEFQVKDQTFSYEAPARRSRPVFLPIVVSRGDYTNAQIRCAPVGGDAPPAPQWPLFCPVCSRFAKLSRRLFQRTPTR